MNGYENNDDSLKSIDIISIDSWLKLLIISMIPVIGQVMLIIWGFRTNSNMTLKNWARAMLIITVLTIFLFFLLWRFFSGYTNWLAAD